MGLTPGPDNIFVLTQSALHGRKTGLLVTLGLCTGLLVHTAAVSLGVATIFQDSKLAFNLLKTIGAIYLVYLAWQAFRVRDNKLEKQPDLSPSKQKFYYRGILMNITNPKVTVFFLAFLPQFADPSKGSITLQITLLGAIFIIATLIVFGSVAWAAGFLENFLKNSKQAQIAMNYIAGMVLVGLSLNLIITEH